MAPSSNVKGVLQVFPHATSLDTTADYHSTLLNQAQAQAARTRDADQSCPWAAADNSNSTSTRPWTAKRPGSSRSMKSFKKSTTRRSQEETTPCPPHADSIQPIGTYTEISSQELEVFKALPTTIRRKLRLRLRLRAGWGFFPLCRLLPSAGRLKDMLPTQVRCYHDLYPTYATTTQRSMQGHASTSGLHSNSSANNNTTTRNVAELLLLLNEKAQTDPTGRAVGRQSVILDAADEALCKAGHRQVRRLSPPVETPTLSSGRPSMDSRASNLQDPPAHHATARDSFYDSFRWLEEDEDLDLSLHIDDYHANHREPMPAPAKERRPSFRRRMSIGKMPFGKSPGSLSRPSTRDMFRAPTLAIAPADPQNQHGRRKSRALSLITPRHTSHVSNVSTASIDSSPAHYQDPEARLKLRAYLSTPQKFDEAVQFGFPSNDVGAPRSCPESQQPNKGDLRRKASDDSEKLKTFLSDERSSIYSDDQSVAGPDTPMTPNSPEKEKQAAKNACSRLEPPPTRDSESSMRDPSVSREMTLRMTLTRPDLRASEDQIYGWQRNLNTRAGRMSQSAPRGDGASNQASCAADAKSKTDYERFFSELDDSAAPACEGGAMKRFWHRVTRN
ncbi:mucin [Apiospora phragmitis]|uniref:Mucin n=1 Tax=Apiospora phragmitis TaxID=2905665 RepID=A0ABR1TTE9_9PEZI